MNVESLHDLRKSFARLESQRHVAALRFYQRLFELDPSLRPMFRTDIEVQARKLMDMLSQALSLADKPERLEAVLSELGRRHVGYGVKDEHYEIVGAALLDMLASVLGRDFTPALRRDWREFYGLMAGTMRSAAAAV